jgi:hypothetical protein
VNFASRRFEPSYSGPYLEKTEIKTVTVMHALSACYRAGSASRGRMISTMRSADVPGGKKPR